MIRPIDIFGITKQYQWEIIFWLINENKAWTISLNNIIFTSLNPAVVRLPKKEITKISEILELILLKAITSKNSVIPKSSITPSLRNFRNSSNFRNLCGLQNVWKYCSLSLRVLGNYGNFRNFIFWKSEHTSRWAWESIWMKRMFVC
jgi:hypothetical protein